MGGSGGVPRWGWRDNTPEGLPHSEATPGLRRSRGVGRGPTFGLAPLQQARHRVGEPGCCPSSGGGGGGGEWALGTPMALALGKAPSCRRRRPGPFTIRVCGWVPQLPRLWAQGLRRRFQAIRCYYFSCCNSSCFSPSSVGDVPSEKTGRRKSAYTTGVSLGRWDNCERASWLTPACSPGRAPPGLLCQPCPVLPEVASQASPGF